MEILKTIPVKQKWMEKSQAMKYFGLENRKSYFQNLLKDFKKSDGYLSPTYKVVLIDVEKFEKFLREREEAKFR